MKRVALAMLTLTLVETSARADKHPPHYIVTAPEDECYELPALWSFFVDDGRYWVQVGGIGEGKQLADAVPPLLTRFRCALAKAPRFAVAPGGKYDDPGYHGRRRFLGLALGYRYNGQHPQIWVDVHESGGTGESLFVSGDKTPEALVDEAVAKLLKRSSPGIADASEKDAKKVQ
jgi:hypothetical protein